MTDFKQLLDEDISRSHSRSILTYGVNNDSKKPKTTLLLFDLSIYGHHPAYIKYLIEYWCRHNLSGHLTIVVSEKFPQVHLDVIEFAAEKRPSDISFVAITPAEESSLRSRHSFLSRTMRGFQEWALLQKYARAFDPQHTLLMYFDTCGIPLAAGVKLSCSFSGIYFRPTFHYDQLPNYVPSRSSRLQKIREQLTLTLALRNPNLENLLCLDPIAAEQLNNKGIDAVSIVHLPDPIDTTPNASIRTATIQEKFGIDLERKVCFLFGALTQRKGIEPLLQSVLELSAEQCQQLCFLFIGEAGEDNKRKFDELIETVCKKKPVQIVRHYNFVPDEDISAYFDLADLVLAPYQKHVGMSGILLWAAAHGKPLLSSDYGLMGKLVQDHTLGLVVDSTQPVEIAKGLTQFLQDGLEKYCDQEKMKAFAAQNSAENFSKVIFETVL